MLAFFFPPLPALVLLGTSDADPEAGEPVLCLSLWVGRACAREEVVSFVLPLATDGALCLLKLKPAMNSSAFPPSPSKFFK